MRHHPTDGAMLYVALRGASRRNGIVPPGLKVVSFVRRTGVGTWQHLTGGLPNFYMTRLAI